MNVALTSHRESVNVALTSLRVCVKLLEHRIVALTSHRVRVN